MEKLTDAGMAAQLAGAVGVGPVDVGTDVAGGVITVVGGAGGLKVCDQKASAQRLALTHDVVGAGGAAPRRH